MKKGSTLFVVIGAIVAVALAGVVAYFIGFTAGKSAQKKIFEQQEEEKKYHVDVYLVKQRMDQISELATQKLTYEGYTPFEKGKIPFLTKKKGVMDFKAEIKAGIDMDKVEIKDQGDKIVIDLPRAEVFSIYIDPNTLEFRDENFALFNWDKKEDVQDILVDTEKAVRENADLDKLLEEADDHARDLFDSLYADWIEEGEVEIR